MVPVTGSASTPSRPTGYDMALPLDNPSYFTINSGTLPCPGKGKFRLFKKKMGATSSHEAIPEVNSPRKPLRSLLRSVSSNSADSNQELLVLGEPRLSDIAPSSPYLSSHKKQNKPICETVANDLIYSPLATSEEAADEINYTDAEEEEVFLTEDSAKYYNLSASRENGRRHSIGTYLSQERERALSVASSSRSCREEAMVHATIDGEVVRPTTVSVSSEEHSQRNTRLPRRRCTRCNVKGAGCSPSCSAGMDDILIVSSRGTQAATLWVNYFGTCFEQISRQKDRPAPKVFNLGIEEISNEHCISTQLEHRVSSVKLNIIIVCPALLAHVASNPKISAALCNLLKPERTIAMLLGVADEDLTEVHSAALVSYRQWQRHPVGVDQDQEFARDFLSAAMGILAKVTRQQHAAAMEERTTFSIMPKKVKQSQNRLVVLLADPLARDDTVRVSVDNNGELLEVKPVKRRNPYTLKFTMPDRCLEKSSIVNVLVEKNGNVLGARPVKCESRLRELDQILRSINDPIEFMCQTLGFSPSNADQLDDWMVNSFQRNLPPHFNLVASAGAGASSRGSGNTPGVRTPGRHPHGHEEFPTLLHFAAKYGLERLAWQLLECPGGEGACELRNACDLTPAEIAENAGHSKLASSLKGYMQMNEFTNMYSQLKELSTKPPPPDVDEDEYLLPRSANLTYSIPPPARPYSPAVQTNANRPITGYLEMQPASRHASGSSFTGRATPTGRVTPLAKHVDQISEPSSSKPATPQPPAEQTEGTRSVTNSEPSKGDNMYEDKVQGELLEIINDFKNKIYDFDELEQLVHSWRNRNDVQKSFKEKEEQLNLMRREYERIQQRMKEEMKKPTPFERIRKLFSRRNKNVPENNIFLPNDVKFETTFVGAEEKTNNESVPANGQNHHRPISSLSLQSTASSSSSGRMSTISGCSATSLGDSGTHSDHEERKHLMRQTSSDHEYFEINDPKKPQGSYYHIPPPAKPVYKYSPLKQNITPSQQFSTITERPPHPVPRVETPSEVGEHYIQFPPSGLPVNGALVTENNKQKSRTPSPMPILEESADYITPVEGPQVDYMNMPAPGSVPEQTTAPELPEYINFHPQEIPAPALPPRN